MDLRWQWNLQFLWLAMVSLLMLQPYFNHQVGRTMATLIREDVRPAPSVRLFMDDHQVVMHNGIVNITFSTQGGSITGVSYNGVDNLLEALNKYDDRGYWDMVWNKTDSAAIVERLVGSTHEVILQNESQIEISFRRMWNVSKNGADEDSGAKVPLNVDRRFVMLRGCPGFYTYAVLERSKGWPRLGIQEARLVFKLRKNKFHFMAMSEERQRMMPTLVDRENGNVLDCPEAVQLTHITNPSFKGEVDDKYFYSCENMENRVHGWVSSDPAVGFWMITPRDEFRTGGPFKQDLTSHTGPVLLNMFASNHYSGEPMQFENGEPWKKVLGPVFVYLNTHSAAKTNPSILWRDAKQRMLKEEAKWPYTFPLSKDYIQSNQRGRVRGQLLVLDRYISMHPLPGSSAYVGLARPGAAGSWQRETKGYQFWTKADSNGHFLIKDVIAGTYGLYAWVPGIIGDYKYHADVIIEPGSDITLGSLVYKPPRNGPTLWEIGVADRTAAEFYIPNPKPSFKVHKFKSSQERFREYGLWMRYADLYPVNDLVYTVGKSNHSKDWFFAQVTRSMGNHKYTATTWRIIFDLKDLKRHGSYTLQLALASANQADLHVRFNDRNAAEPHFATGLIGKDNAVARHGIHGLYWQYSIKVAGNLLVKGRNTIFLTQSSDSNPFREIMYDYIRFEAPAGKIF